MLAQYLKKFTIDILPSIVATIIGAYIVNYYIVPKARQATQPAVAVSVPATETTASIPEPAIAKTSSDDEPLPAGKGAGDKVRSESASPLPAARHQPPARERAAAKTPAKSEKAEARGEAVSAAPASAPASVTASAPASVTANTTTASPAPEERHNAADLARAAIARLRGPAAPDSSRAQESSKQESSKAESLRQEASRSPETRAEPILPPRVEATAPVQPVALQPLPPPVTIATQPGEDVYGLRDNADGTGGASARTGTMQQASRRPTPPAEIPSQPIDLHADVEPSRAAKVADDVFSAAKSMFNAVLPR